MKFQISNDTKTTSEVQKLEQLNNFKNLSYVNNLIFTKSQIYKITNLQHLKLTMSHLQKFLNSRDSHVKNLPLTMKHEGLEEKDH